MYIHRTWILCAWQRSFDKDTVYMSIFKYWSHKDVAHGGHTCCYECINPAITTTFGLEGVFPFWENLLANASSLLPYQPTSTYTARMSVHRPAGGKSPPCPVQGAAVSDSAPAGSVGLVTTCWCWSKSTNSCNSWSAGSTPTSQPLKLLNIIMGVFVFSWSYQRSTHVPKLWYCKTQMRSVIFILGHTDWGHGGGWKNGGVVWEAIP